MTWRVWARLALPVVWTFAPMYGIERLANFYYLADNSAAFFSVSGWRLPLFILFALAGSVAAGALTRDFWRSLISQIAALLLLLAAVFVFCDPRVCYSAGIDGLEPLRMGYFLASVAVSASALGVAIQRGDLSRKARIVASFFAFSALGYYPIIFTFAGSRLLPPSSPYAAALVLGLASFSTSIAASLDLGSRLGIAIPVTSLVTLLALSTGIATAYLETVASALMIIVLFAVVSAAAGAILSRFGRVLVRGRRAWFGGFYTAGIVLVLTMLIFTVPDSVSGLGSATHGGGIAFEIGVPVYTGAFMDAPPGHAFGAGVNVSFADTDPTSIQADNFLAAGIGIHAAGCCVDGIDYAYRFDLYLFHDGNESLVASAWQVCDDNAACGGHSWKNLLFFRSVPIGQLATNETVCLRMAWEGVQGGAGVSWFYSIGKGQKNTLAIFHVPPAENHDFNTGVLNGGTLSPQQTGSYFFQFGMMSKYPIGHGGWRVIMNCPSTLEVGWSCVNHAKTITGMQSFWKVFWRFGEDYPNVATASSGPADLTFGYSTAAPNGDFQRLW